MEQPDTLDALCAALAQHHRHHRGLVLCHGGGKDINRNLKWLGEAPQFKDGLRVTSEAAMAVVEMTLSGSVNKTLVSLLQRHGARACGISGVDGGTLTCRPLDPDLGRVGEVSKVDAGLVETLLHAGFLPVLSPVSADIHHAHYNVNADEAASALAVAMQATRLFFVSDVPGVLDESTRIIPKLNRDSIQELIARGVATGGIIPKLKSCAQAVEAGVGAVHICGFDGADALREQLKGQKHAGTVIEPAAPASPA